MLTSKKIGSVAVDSGQIMVGDPCYLRDFKSDEFRSKRIYVKSRESDDGIKLLDDKLEYGIDFNHYEEVIERYGKTMNELNSTGEWELVQYKPSGDYSYNGACQATCSPSQAGQLGDGLAVVATSGFGDGFYPVHATFLDGRVQSITVTFFTDDDDDETLAPDEDYS